MPLPESFLRHVSAASLFNQGDGLLLAVSGGVDSVVLASLCHRAGFTFAIAHANFQLRGAESERDEAFVRELAQRYSVPFFGERFNTSDYAHAHQLSIQVAARELRYDWFHSILKADPRWRYLLTAHHADDQVETVLMHFFRGTGIAGLRGIPARQEAVRRPLLPFRKEELLQFAREEGLDWVEDQTNITESYTRNYIRNTLLPAVEIVYPAAAENLLQNTARLGEAFELYQQGLERHRRQLLWVKGDEVHLPVEKLRQARPLKTVYYELMKDFGFTPAQLPDLLHLLDSPTGKFLSSSTHRVIKNRHWLVIAPLRAEAVHHLPIESLPHTVTAGAFEFRFMAVAPPVEVTGPDPRVAYVDAGLLQFPLLLRHWRAGDYFYPLGMRKKKKLARFFIDQKLSKRDKEQVWVLLSGQQVVWVAGHRIDERFKVTASTRQVAKLSVTAL